MAAFWALFLVWVILTRGPWWLAMIAAVFIVINVWRIQSVNPRQSTGGNRRD